MNTDCPNCYGYPCVCEEIKNYKPLQAIYMWLEKENKMVLLNDFPLHPKLKRLWNQSVSLK